MRFSKFIVDLKGLYSGGLRLRVRFLSRGPTVIWKDGIGIGQSGVSRSVGRIFVDSLVKVVNRCLEAIACSLVPEISPFQVKLMCFRVFCRLITNCLFFPAGEFCFQFVRDSLGNLSLDNENICQLAIIGIRPQVGIAGGFN